MGLGYPGGVVIDKKSKDGSNNIEFVTHAMLPNTFDFSFSGVKTRVINYINKLNMKKEELPVDDICTSFQTQVMNEVVDKTIKACIKYKEKKLVVGGGVSANSYLREKLLEKGKENNIEVYFPEMSLSGDNGAMIASEGYYQIISGKGLAGLDLSPAPNINLKWERRKQKF